MLRIVLALGLMIAQLQPLAACSRIFLEAPDGIAITARSLDWVQDMYSDLWVFPRGMERDGASGPQSIQWASTYGSVIVSCYNSGTADGMNEKGLVANLLYLAESEYEKPTGKKPLLSISLWAQYVLDNYATVAEAVDALRNEPFTMLVPMLPNGSLAQLHLSISDVHGDSAIFEYLSGKLVIHHGKQYTVMTNSPTFSEQLALDSYWQSIGGLAFLPGTNRAADRFARASFLLSAIPKKIAPQYIEAVPGKTFVNQVLSSMLGIIRSVSVPLGITTPNEPNIASTLWRTVSDQKNKVYFFDSATSPDTFWVSFADLHFEKGAPAKKLSLSGGKVYSGNAAASFEVAKPFKFLSGN